MKKITTNEAKKVVGGDDCWGSYQWNGNRCEYVTWCNDKHGTYKESATQAGSTYYCPPR